MPEDATNFVTGLLTTLRQRLTDPDFRERHRRSPKDFVRERCLPFVVVVLFLLNLVKRALQDELDEFFKLDSDAVVITRTVTKSAFSQARKKLKAEAFIELNRVQIEYFYTHFAYKTWQGFRVVAVDGSTAQLLATPDIIANFDLWGDVPLARVSQVIPEFKTSHFARPGSSDPAGAGGRTIFLETPQMFDVLNKVTIDAWIGNKAQGERECAAQHFVFIGSHDLVLLDRGCPAFWLFVLILTQNANFCARMTMGQWKVVDEFLASGQREQIVTLEPCTSAEQDCQTRGLSRFVCCVLNWIAAR